MGAAFLWKKKILSIGNFVVFSFKFSPKHRLSLSSWSFRSVYYKMFFFFFFSNWNYYRLSWTQPNECFFTVGTQKKREYGLYKRKYIIKCLNNHELRHYCPSKFLSMFFRVLAWMFLFKVNLMWVFSFERYYSLYT